VTILIFANGDVGDVAWVKPYLSTATAVIAADGGTRHLWRLNHVPDLVIGDLDSLPEEAGVWLESGESAVRRYPHDKDETDLELALTYAVEHYEEPIAIIGASGGRLDQTLANIMLLAHPALAGRHVELLTEHQHAWLVTAETIIHGQAGDIVSLVPIGGPVHIRQTSGLRWQLQDEMLTFGMARGVSNTMTGSEAQIIVDEGHLLCIHTSGQWNR
jgi:thiamine pyrophosphokinase